jgi:hypothetical protein
MSHIGVGTDDGERANPLAGSRLLPVLPDACETERRAILHGDGIGLLRPLAPDGLPLEEAVHRHDAAALAVGIPERRELPHGLALGVDGFLAPRWVLAPVRNEASAERVERDLAGLVIPPDDQEFLARRGVPARRVVVHPAVAHVHAINDGQRKGEDGNRSRGQRAEKRGDSRH